MVEGQAERNGGNATAAEGGMAVTLTGNQGFAALPIDRAQSARLMLEGALREALGKEVRARLLPRRGGVRIAARLGPDAPPGQHRAILATEDGEYPVTIDIPSHPRLRARPASVDVAAASGERVRFTLILENAGNVALPLPGKAVAGFFASDGVATAFSAAYRSDAEDGLAVLGQFIGHLRRSHLGLAQLRFFDQGDGLIAPGQSREVTAELAVPRSQDIATQTGAGRRFHAVFVMDHLRLTVRLTLAPQAPEREAK